MKSLSPYYIVGIGLSGLGLQPLDKLFDQLPIELDAAFIVAGHLFPGFKSDMVGILQKHTGKPVSWATDQQRIKSDHVYILSENRMVSIKNGKLHVRKSTADEPINKAIDILFGSMLHELGSRGISIILSGMDGDGSVGSIKIYRHGVITFAQKTESAPNADILETAVLKGEIMFVRSVTNIASLLTEIIKVKAPVSK